MNLLERVQPEHCALVIVDVQNDFCHPEGACGKRGNDLSSVAAMVPKLKTLIENARKKGVSVVFIRTEHDEKTDSLAWKSRYGTKPKPNSQLSCRTGSWGAEFYEVEPQEDDLVITKHRYSGFAGTNLDLLLKTAKKTSLLFTGVATNICVESTLRDGLSLDYYVTLVEDCCATFAPEDHQSTIRNVRSQYGLVSTSDEIADLWNQ